MEKLNRVQKWSILGLKTWGQGGGAGSAPATDDKHDRKFQMSQNVEECLRFFISTGICRVSPLLDPNGLGVVHIPLMS